MSLLMELRIIWVGVFYKYVAPDGAGWRSFVVGFENVSLVVSNTELFQQLHIFFTE
jgi:hypothetical protein